MAAIQEGDTIQASWFQDQDNTGPYTQLTMLNDSSDFNIIKNGSNLIVIVKDGSNDGLLKLKNALEDYADI